MEGIRRRIFEYGGKVVGEQDRANYVVQEDGHFADIWNTEDQCMQDDKQRNIVHYRWVDECIRQQEILMHHE